MAFTKEADFEEALIKILTQKGWSPDVIKYPTEEDLLKNWADILYKNNNTIDRLNDCRLTDSEMHQIIEQILTLRTPLKLNEFINGTTVSIIRDNPDDKLHLGKTVSLKIYDRKEIAAGQSVYQIVQQPVFKSKSKMLSNRRGDLVLLINGMPVFHIELKSSSVPLSDAFHQIEKYSFEGIFTGLFSLVQIFVAMTPEDTVYFANPGPDGKFNDSFYFHWADFNNEPIRNWKDVASTLLSIPMAHQLIGFYTVADDSDGVLKVMRSYQYYAANAISDRVSKTDWNSKHLLGGYIWHTTGSGKTMTSFKSAQLIASSKDADKVIFLMDRIELGTQSLEEYRAFADKSESIQGTDNTGVLRGKLVSDNHADTLIVTSIQKMSRVKDDEYGLNAAEMEKLQSKRIVFIIDEAHRSTFGDMLLTIKQTFPYAIFFGFTGTPIQEENQKKYNTTASIFGKELHSYSIADGMRDGNVLGFDPCKILTFRDKDVRGAVAMNQAKAADFNEVLADPKKEAVYRRFMDKEQVAMAGGYDSEGKYVKGIEDYIPNSQYETKAHQEKVVEDIAENWQTLSSSNGVRFHAIFATSSIPEAVSYYRMIKDKIPELKITALFDPTIDNSGSERVELKETGISEMLNDYNNMYEQNFNIPTYAFFKKDVSARLAHKGAYQRIEREPEKQLDLLIVVNQMLTGFDSKWINTLYMDKLMEYENIIQAFSRTNRLFGKQKPFGTIRYYRRPHTMERNIRDAVRLYSGNKPTDLFAPKIGQNIISINAIYDEIRMIFQNAGIPDIDRLPDNAAEKRKFASLFKEMNAHIEAARIQGFTWEESIYNLDNNVNISSDACNPHAETDADASVVQLSFGLQEYGILEQRYTDMRQPPDPADPADPADGDTIPFDLDGYLSEVDTDRINADYMNSRFEKYLRFLGQDGLSEDELENALNDLHKSFAALPREEQKFANIFLHDVQSGNIKLEVNKSFREYIYEYMATDKLLQIRRLVLYLGVDKEKLSSLMNSKVTENDIDSYGRFGELKKTVDKAKAKEYFEKCEGCKIPQLKVNVKTDRLLRDFILRGGFDIQEL